AAYKLDLSPDMKRRRIHPTFNANLLRMYIPNDDVKFPGRHWEHILDLGTDPKEKSVLEVIGHAKRNSQWGFYTRWSDGFITEEPLENVRQTQPFEDY
ncbi:hypothetical protein EXIGLDRAFT_581248, partial [Exidia glandulosa HHB12029]